MDVGALRHQHGTHSPAKPWASAHLGEITKQPFLQTQHYSHSELQTVLTRTLKPPRDQHKNYTKGHFTHAKKYLTYPPTQLNFGGPNNLKAQSNSGVSYIIS